MKIRISTIIRSVVLIVCVVSAALSYPFVPAASPLLAFYSSVALRAVTISGLFALPLLILGFLKGRWFCYHICPAGFMLERSGKINFRNRGLFARAPNIRYWILLLGFGGAVVGIPLFLWLDPLVLFNGFFSAIGSFSGVWTDWLPAAGFGAVIILNMLVPNIWCQRLCPLGAALGLAGSVFGMSGRAGEKLDKKREDPRFGRESQRMPMRRRSFLFLLGGLGAGSVLRSLGRADVMKVIRPPGSVAEERFRYLCARCGNCFQSCPDSIIKPDLGRSGIPGLLTPALDFSRRYCNERCNECGKVCPTGAIRRLSIEKKNSLAIGLARIEKEHCLAWADEKYCMVCHEYCPFRAIDFVVHKGVNAPVMKDDLCRGCGACESHCPARPVPAIRVHGIEQRPVAVDKS